MTSDWDSLKLWGVLPQDEGDAPALGDLAERWVNLLKPPTTENPHSVRVHREQEKPVDTEVATPTELREHVVDADHVHLAPSSGDEYRYQDLPVSVRLLSDRVPFRTAPAYEVWIPADAFVADTGESTTVDATRINQAVDLISTAHQTFNAVFSYGFAEVDVFPPDYHPDGNTLRSGSLEQLYWCNVLSPRIVSTVGRERVLATPAKRTEEFPDGSVLIAVFNNPFSENTSAIRTAESHLGLKSHHSSR